MSIEPSGDGRPEVALRTRSRLDTARELVEAVANLDPTGVMSTGAAMLNIFLPTSLERRRAEFYEQVAKRLAQVQVDLDRIDDRLATAALAQGTLASARSATDDHLWYLATATARAMVSSDELGADHAMLLLRIAGEISSTHIRVLDIYADPHRVAAEPGRGFEWKPDKHGRYRLMQVIEELDPLLAEDVGFVRAVFGDLERLGLLGDDDPMDRVFDGGGPTIPPPDEVTTLGHELLAFVAMSDDSRAPDQPDGAGPI